MLHPSFRSDDQVQEEVVRSLDADEDEWRWGEQIRAAIHAYTLDINGRDELPLYNRVDIVRGAADDDNDFYVMEISLIDASLYLSADPQHMVKFADAIVARALW